MVAAVSIDEAASGFLRLRFVNAISAAWIVLYAVVAVFLALAAIVMAGRQDPSSVLLLIGVLAVSLLLIPVVGALLDLLPSQLVGLVGFLTSFALVALSLLICVQALSAQLSRDSMTDYDAVQTWTGVAVVGLSLPIFAEGLGWSWWQLRASRDDFHAARGWRPPTWRIFSALRARLGLPAFISNFGRGRAGLSVIYLLIAVLNLGLVALIFAPLIASYIARDNTILTPYFIVGGFLALPLLNILGVGAFFERIASRQATRLYQDARDWDARPPIVFLRAFDQDTLRLKVRSRDPALAECFPSVEGRASLKWSLGGLGGVDHEPRQHTWGRGVLGRARIRVRR